MVFSHPQSNLIPYANLIRNIKIVDDDSSRLDDAREGSDFINANHMMMCRFRDENDEGYNKVKGVVSKYMDEIQAQIAKERDSTE